MPRRIFLVIGAIGLIGLSAWAVVATRQSVPSGAESFESPAAAANVSTPAGRASVGVAPSDRNTAGQGRAPGVSPSRSAIGAPSTSRPPAASGGGAVTAAGNPAGGQCTNVPFFHCYTK